MGVKHLWDVLESCKKTLPLHHLRNKRVCVDLSCWIVQLHNVSKSHNAIKEKLYLQGLFHRLRALIALNCTLIFVADGSIPSIKLSTYRRRLNSGHEVVQDDTNPHNQCSLRRNMGSEFSCMIKEAKLLGLALGVPCLDGIEEAEAQCALLNSESLCDGCFTSDSDVFLFGARTVYRDISLGEGGHVICYEMEDIERKLGFGRNSLITLALLLGGDYSHGVHGLGPESACQIVRTFGEKSVLQQIVSEGLPVVRKTKNSKKQMQIRKDSEIDTNGNDNNLQRRRQFLLVIEAYLKPKCHSADSDKVFRVLAQHPFQHTKFQQICAQFFGWSPEKTDEYILPKVAERNLQRFANLRSISAGVGVKPPVDKMPVKCPVSEIVKQRKVQGRECFEVLWEGFDGLKTSVVPAVLVESACPEKIAEFDEKRALCKKQNNRKQRPKKSENRSAAELDLKLQNLLLDIESESDHVRNITSPSRTVVSEDRITTTMVDFMKQEPFYTESKSNNHLNAATSCYHPVTSMAKLEVIDLSSPSPIVRSCTVTSCQRVNNQHVDVIDLSESENEASPQHMRKAKELRLFLANIKDDIL